MKVFLAHPKNADDLQLADWEHEVGRHISGDVVFGRDDFAAQIAIDGTFDAWARGVASRRDSYTQEPVYGAIVSPVDQVGKATAQIVVEALRLGTPVYLMERGEVRRVSDVAQLDGENYAGGWRLV